MGTLAFLTQLDLSSRLNNDKEHPLTPESDLLVKWVLERQTTYIEEPDEYEEGEDDNIGPEQSSFRSETASNSISPESVDTPYQAHVAEDLATVGFNGRPNKVADTCYCWWNLGSLAVCPHVGDVQKQC